MLITFQASSITPVLNAAIGVVSSGVTKDKQYIILQAEKDSVHLFARGGNTELRIKFDEAVVKEPGTVAIPPRRFAQVLSASNGEVQIKAKTPTKIAVKNSIGQTTLNAPDPDIIDTKVQEAPAGFCYVGTGELSYALKVCQSSAGEGAGGGRYSTNGIRFELWPDRQTIAATNGRRVTRVALETANPQNVYTGKKVGGTTPIRPINNLIRIVNAVGIEELKISITENSIFVIEDESLYYRTSLLHGRFPPVDNVLDFTRDSVSFHIKIGDLIDGLRQVDLVSAHEDNHESHQAHFEIEDSKIKLSGRNKDIGSSVATIPCEYRGKETIKVILDSRMLLSHLKNFPRDNNVKFDFLTEDTGVFLIIKNVDYCQSPIS